MTYPIKWYPSANVSPTSSEALDAGEAPVRNDVLDRIEKKVWELSAAPSDTYTLRVITLRRIISRLREAEAKLVEHKAGNEQQKETNG